MRMRLPAGRLHLWLDFYQAPGKKLPDDDNMLGRCKAYRDGIAQVLGIDDIGRDESSYRERWRGVYEWLLDKMREAEQDAAATMAWSLRNLPESVCSHQID